MRKIFLLRLCSFLLVICISACVDRIDFDSPEASAQIVVEGMITDGPGPHVVKISNAFEVDADSIKWLPVQGAQVQLFAQGDLLETLQESSPGIYATSASTQGTIGTSYSVRITTAQGKVIESTPELLNPVGQIGSIYHELEPRSIEGEFSTIRADVFNVFVDATTVGSSEAFVRFRFRGTYKVITYPELHQTHNPPYTPYKDPYPCSGYELDYGPFGSGGTLIKVGDCSCCTCWAGQPEEAPQLLTNDLIANGKVQRFKVAEVPINHVTFHEKYMVEVEQMSLTREGYDFFQKVRTQKLNSGDLFQTTPARINGNLHVVNSSEIVLGYFWASAVNRKHIFISRDEVPYPLIPIDFVAEPCTFYENSTTVQPENWE